MSERPIRLVDDEGFLARTGIDLAAEAELLAGAAAEPVKQKLLAALSTGAITATAAHTAAVSMAVKAAVISAVVGAGVGGSAVYVAATPAAPAPVVGEQVVEDAGPDNLEDAGPQNERLDAGPAPEKAATQKKRPGKKADLAAELRLYERGEAALTAKKFKVAAREFGAYLRQYKGGSLRQEAQLGQLEAKMGAGQYASALRLARRLLRQSGFSARKVELIQVEGDALAKLGRCDEAEKSYRKVLARGGTPPRSEGIERALAACRRDR